MPPRRVCFAYRWATYGGVERVFLNRALAFAARGEQVQIDVYYGADAGGLAPFVEAITDLGLGQLLRVAPTLEADAYDAVFVIDSPEMLPARIDGKTRWFVECHTPYTDNRAYLASLPIGVAGIAVPSRTFAATVAAERPELRDRIVLLRNCVAPERSERAPRLPLWQQRPLLYFGRLDELKNPQGLLDLLAELERRDAGRYIGVVLGPELAGYDLAARIDRAGLRGRVVQLPPLSFLRTGAFLAAWRQRGGVMVSPSFGESFGLAAAESIAAGVPVLLSRLPEHAELVQDDGRHLYDVADVAGGADRIECMFEDYAGCSRRMLATARAFGDEAFIEDWRALMDGRDGSVSAAGKDLSK